MAVVEKALLVVLTRHPKLAMSRLVRGSVPDQVMREAGCPVLAVPPRAKRPRPALREMAATGEAWAGRSGALGWTHETADGRTAVASGLGGQCPWRTVAVKGRRAKGAGDETKSGY